MCYFSDATDPTAWILGICGNPEWAAALGDSAPGLSLMSVPLVEAN